MPTPITKKGYEALKAELDRLRTVERPKVIEAIAEARTHGDLSENACRTGIPVEEAVHTRRAG